MLKRGGTFHLLKLRGESTNVTVCVHPPAWPLNKQPGAFSRWHLRPLELCCALKAAA